MRLAMVASHCVITPSYSNKEKMMNIVKGLISHQGGKRLLGIAFLAVRGRNTIIVVVEYEAEYEAVLRYKVTSVAWCTIWQPPWVGLD